MPAGGAIGLFIIWFIKFLITNKNKKDQDVDKKLDRLKSEISNKYEAIVREFQAKIDNVIEKMERVADKDIEIVQTFMHELAELSKMLQVFRHEVKTELVNYVDQRISDLRSYIDKN